MNQKQQTPAKPKENSPLSVLMRKPLFGNPIKKNRQVVHYDKFSRKEEEGVIQLYEELVPSDKTRTIDIKMIVEEGFPAFEETIGVANFNRVKKYFGIGCKANKERLNPKEVVQIQLLIFQLRTIQNAQYYIVGYKELLEKTASKITDAPEGMTILEKAKFVRMFYIVFAGYYYFAEDYCQVIVGDKKALDVDFDEALKNNSKMLYPEELFDLYIILIQCCDKEDLLYEVICYELDRVKEKNRKLLKEILQFAELTQNEEGNYVSVNVAPQEQSFSAIRSLKNRIHPEIGVFMMETFASKSNLERANFDDLYQMYKLFKTIPLENCQQITQNIYYLEGSRKVKKDRVFYKVAEGLLVSGETEIQRFIHCFEYRAGRNFEMPMSGNRTCKSGQYMGSIKFCNEMGYLTCFTSVQYDFESAEKIIALDHDDAILKYGQELITAEELKEILGIDAKFEFEVFGIETEATPEEAAIDFAISNSYAESKEAVSQELLANVVLPGNEDHFVKFSKGEIDESTLKHRIGFEDEFAEMYFNLSKVDVTAIEAKLQELKRGLAKKGEIKKSALVISLYCYLIEEQVPCGPKNKAAKRNKGLKPSNLKALIA